MDIILENKQFRLTVSSGCIAKSLIHEASGQECLEASEEVALFSVTQPRPFNNEVKLAYPNKRTVFQANRLRREGDRLIVGFEITPYEAVIRVKITEDYMTFRLEDFIVHPTDYGHLRITPPPVESFRLLQLPVKHRENFGQWLNVCWDDAVAVNVLATSPYETIDSEKRKNSRILTADATRGIRLRGTEAALIVTDSNALLDAIDVLEQDYGLPRGVQSRRSGKLRISSYATRGLTPENVDEHIRRCKQCGFGMMTIYYTELCKAERYYYCGDYDLKPEYPEGLESIRNMLQKIKAAGIIPGFHFLHTHIGLKSRYVTPVADHRLHKTRYFTLARPLTAEDTTVYVQEDPEGSILAEGCRVLQFGGELISYDGFSPERPYCFTGCTRGHLNTCVTEHPLGQVGGILDVSEYGASSCYLDQNSDLQEEIAAKLAKIYDLGFEYIYFDGSEGTNEPYAYHVSSAQYRTWKQMGKAPLYAEGAAKTHFSWHMLSGGNAFDTFRPPVFKEMIRKHPASEAVRMRQDFTRLNFGWWSLFVNETQPDHWEYGSAMAAAWDCPATVNGNLEQFRANARTEDLLEVLRRWEDVRVNGLLTQEQKEMLRQSRGQEYILLINEEKEYELVPYEQLETPDGRLRAFLFERQGQRHAVYWHTCGNGTVKLNAEVELREELYQPARKASTLPVDRRRYIRTDLPTEEVKSLFLNASFTDSPAL